MVSQVTTFWVIIQMLSLLCYSLPYISHYNYGIQLLSDSDEFTFSIQRSFKFIVTTIPTTNNYELLLHAEILLHICLGKVDKWGGGSYFLEP